MFQGACQEVRCIRLRGEDEAAKISEEINLVIDDEVPRMCKARALNRRLQSVLLNKLKSVTNRTYLWLHLVLDEIRNGFESTQRELTQLIDTLPESVDEAYERILGRIRRSTQVAKARRLLQIVVAAVRPLTLQEINVALAVDWDVKESGPRHSYHDLDLLDAPHITEQVRGGCGLFVSVYDSHVYLINQTAKEFLLVTGEAQTTCSDRQHLQWKRSFSWPDANLFLARICMACLSLREFAEQLHRPAEGTYVEGSLVPPGANTWNATQYLDMESDHTLFGFYSYSANHWTTHCEKAQAAMDTTLWSVAMALFDHGT